VSTALAGVLAIITSGAHAVGQLKVRAALKIAFFVNGSEFARTCS
jgi:hypothetical protein